jgi:hypothetical protein
MPVVPEAWSPFHRMASYILVLRPKPLGFAVFVGKSRMYLCDSILTAI